MSASIIKHMPKEEELTRAVNGFEIPAMTQHRKEHIQRAIELSQDTTAPRTEHSKFIVELNAELINRIKR